MAPVRRIDGGEGSPQRWVGGLEPFVGEVAKRGAKVGAAPPLGSRVRERSKSYN